MSTSLKRRRPTIKPQKETPRLPYNNQPGWGERDPNLAATVPEFWFRTTNAYEYPLPCKCHLGDLFAKKETVPSSFTESDTWKALLCKGKCQGTGKRGRYVEPSVFREDKFQQYAEHFRGFHITHARVVRSNLSMGDGVHHWCDIRAKRLKQGDDSRRLCWSERSIVITFEWHDRGGDPPLLIAWQREDSEESAKCEWTKVPVSMEWPAWDVADFMTAIASPTNLTYKLFSGYRKLELPADRTSWSSPKGVNCIMYTAHVCRYLGLNCNQKTWMAKTTAVEALTWLSYLLNPVHAIRKIGGMVVAWVRS